MKKLVSLFLVFTLAFLFSSNVHANASDDKIKDMLLNYLGNSLEQQKELVEITNNYIVPNSELADYTDLNSKVTVKWYKGIGVKIESYNIDIQINSITREGSLIRVDLDSVVKFRYENADFNSGYTENHIIYLKSFDDKLLVEKDIFENGIRAEDIEKDINNLPDLDGYKEYMNSKIKYLEERQFNLDIEIEEFKKPANEEFSSKYINSIGLLSVTYDPQKAANWALNNVYAKEDYIGADCTNFVSKALRAGGLPTDGTWYQGSNAWIRVVELRNWLINKGYATQYSSYSYAQLGDVIQYKKASNGIFSHSVIVTARDNWSTYPYVSAHSSAAYNVLASNYYPNNSYFSGYRVLDVHGK